MIKNNRKILISMLLFLLVTTTFMQSFAFSIGQRNLISLGECERYLTYNGTPVKTTYIVYEKDGNHYPAYCLDVTLPGAENGSYVVDGSSKFQNVEAWRAIINGFPYKSVGELGAANEQEAFTATKHAVYTMLYNRDPGTYGAVDSDSGRRVYQIYLNIVNAARNSQDTIINNIETQVVPVSIEWGIDNKDSSCVSKVYRVNSNVSSGNYSISLQGEVPENTKVVDMNNNAKNKFNVGEEFKIIIPIQKLIKTGEFKIVANSNLNTRPVVYGSTTVPGTQSYALTGFSYEESISSYKENYQKNITKLIVIKKEYGTENRLEGVKFNLLDKDKKIYMKELVTDEKGEIVLENMLPGLYYLEETETLEKFNLYTDLIEIGLDLNEEFQTTVNNTTKEVIEYDKVFEKVEIVPSFSETVYNVQENKTIVEKLPVTGY